jgi:hypothetical protein
MGNNASPGVINYVWDPLGLDWVAETQAGGGGGGPISVADGADVAQGATTDAESAVGNGSVVALLKRLRTLMGGVALEAGGNLATIAGKDFATQTTLAQIKTAVEVIDNFISGARGLVTEDNSAAILAKLEELRAELILKTEPLDSQHVTIDSMPPVSASSAADVLDPDGDALYAVGQLGKNLTQSHDGRLRVAIGALVSDTVESLLADELHSLSLTTEGRLRVSTARESYNFAPWGKPNNFPHRQTHIRRHPLTAW